MLFRSGEAVTFDHDAVTHQVRGYQVSGPDASGGATWERDPRGLTARETFTTNGAPRVRDYTYDARGALATVTSAGELATYSYTASGLPSTTGDLAGVRTVHDGAVGGWLGAPGGPGGGGGGGGDPPTDAMRSLGATATSRVAASPALRAAVGGDATATGAAWLGASAAVRAKVGGAARGVRTAPRAGSTLTPRALDSAVEPRDASASASALGAPAASTPTLTSVRLLTVGDSTYAFDAAGRVVGRDGREFTYGANGQLRHATVGSRAIDYTYDDADQRILKRVNGVPVRAEAAGGVLTEDHFVELVAIGGVVVGVLDNGVFSTLPTDPRGTPLTGLDGAANLATAYGVRQVHAAVSEVVDYARLGWDADLEVVRQTIARLAHTLRSRPAIPRRHFRRWRGKLLLFGGFTHTYATNPEQMPMARLVARKFLPAIFGAKSLRAGLKVNLIGLRKYESGQRVQRCPHTPIPQAKGGAGIPAPPF